MLIYRSIDVTCNGRVVQGSLETVEFDPSTLAQDFDSRATLWTGVDHNVSVFEMGTLTSVTWSGSYCWPAPANVDLPPGFDSYIVLYDVDANDPATGINPYGGLAYNGLFNGYTYATVPVMDGDEWWFPSGEAPSLAMQHEWMHGVGGFYRATFGSFQVPGIHDRDIYGYTSDVYWTRDYMGGDINGSIGLTPAIWGSGTPTSDAEATPPPPTPPPPTPSPEPPNESQGECKNPKSNSKACR